MKTKLKTALIVTMITMFASGYALGILSGQYRIPSTGTLGTDLKIMVYNDRDCTIPCTTLDWSHIEKNVEQVKCVFVKNENAVPVLISTTTENWNPAELADYVDFSANLYSEPNLASGEVKELDIHLTIFQNCSETITDLSFDIVVTGTEQ